MFWKDILHICLSWLAAVEHGKIEENTVNSGIFDGVGPTLWPKRVICSVFSRKHSVKNNVLEGYLEHGKIQENTVNSSIFEGLGTPRGRKQFPSLGTPQGGEK